ncbi:MAG: class II aldolase/adducin family protein [Beijerinckiaceae bacterium]
MAVQPVQISRAARPRAEMSEAEWKARVDLAACYRLIALAELDDQTATHLTLRVPDEPGHFLINPYGLLFCQVTASNLVKVDIDGNIVSETDYSINPAGFVIHSAIHAARPDAHCIIHTHTVAGMAVACLEEGLLPISQKSLRFAGSRLAYHDYEGKSDDLDERARLVRDLGSANALILRNHGLLVCAPTVGRAYHAMMNLEKSCRTQLAAMASGGKLIKLSDAVIEHAAQQHARDDVPGQNGRPDAWPAHLARLDKIDPDYKT